MSETVEQQIPETQSSDLGCGFHGMKEVEAGFLTRQRLAVKRHHGGTVAVLSPELHYPE